MSIPFRKVPNLKFYNFRRYSSRFQTQNSMRRSIRTSQRSADSGIDPYYDAGMGHAYSEMDFR